MMVLEPPGELIREIQRKMVAFFWSGQHWIRAAVLFLPVAEGGQGLVDIQSRVKAFRLQSVKRLLYQRDLPWTQLAGGILHRAGGLGYDLQLFWIRLAEVSLSGLTPFYRSLLQVWKTVFEVSRGAGLSGAWIREEPLLYNPLLQTRLLSSSSIRACLLRSGCTKLGHVLQTNGWRSPTELRKVTGLYSPRLVTQLLEEVESVLPGCYRELVVRGGTLDRQAAGAPAPNLTVRLAVQLDQEEETVPGTLFHIPALGRFQEVPRDALYLACVKVAHQAVLKRQRLSHWPGLFGPDFPLRDRWRSLYKPPIEKRSGDLQWRIIHGAIATDRHVAHLNPAVVGQSCSEYSHTVPADFAVGVKEHQAFRTWDIALTMVVNQKAGLVAEDDPLPFRATPPTSGPLNPGEKHSSTDSGTMDFAKTYRQLQTGGHDDRQLQTGGHDDRQLQTGGHDDRQLQTGGYDDRQLQTGGSYRQEVMTT
ncbi:hypothetical protein NFI96_013182, partial [Prochilodus magdalenae]